MADDQHLQNDDVIENTDETNDITTAEESFDSDNYQATQNLIMRLGRQQDELIEKLKQHREMLKNIFDNDAEISTAQVVADEATQKLKQRKSTLNETQQVIDLKSKIKDVNEDLKLVKESLNNHLINYFQLTGSTALDLPDGQEREFTLNARLKRPKQAE